MTVTRAQAMTNTREMMDATGSARWGDPIVRTVLGIITDVEWGGILAANPFYRFASRSVTCATDGTFPYTALNSGSADATQTYYRILSVNDGSVLYRQTSFMQMPMATSSNYASPYDKYWYDAGSNVQTLPVAANVLTVAVNWMPPRVDSLSGDGVNIDFPDGAEVILWLEAAAMLLSKGGAENDAAQTMRAMADEQRQSLYSDIARRAARPLSLGFNDGASEWAG